MLFFPELQRGASSIIKLEITGGKGSVQVNGKAHHKSSSPLTLTGGDELIFGSVGKYAYVSFWNKIVIFNFSVKPFLILIITSSVLL